MGRKEILEVLRSCKKEFAEEYRILDIGIFGSVARGETNKNGDVDVVIHVSEPDFFMLAGIKNILQERFLRSVDIVAYRENMNEFLKKRIDTEAIYV